MYLEIAINLFCLQGFKSLISVHFNIRAIKKQGGENVAAKMYKILTLFSVGAICYGFMEILNRGYSHITMGVLGGTSMLVIHIMNGERRRGVSLLSVLAVSAAFITAIEFLAGEYLNRYLGMDRYACHLLLCGLGYPILVCLRIILYADIFSRNTLSLLNEEKKKYLRRLDKSTIICTAQYVKI